jgi:FtsP/CotA-like multicopper oxidase with cupredoxin domain
MTTATEPDQSSRADTLGVFGIVLALGAIFFAIVGIGIAWRAADDARSAGVSTGASGRAGVSAPAEVMVHLADLEIEPATIEIAAGGTLQAMNTGATTHNLAVEGKDLATAMLDAGGAAALPLTGLEPGDYTAYCQVPGHKEAGMKAELKVVDAGATPAAEAATHSPAKMDETMAARTKAFPAKTTGEGGTVLAPTIAADGTKRFDLTTKVVDWEVEPGRTVKAMAYNGVVPGPTIRVSPGDKIKVVLHNELPESTVVHFHGLDLPVELDGVPDITQAPVKPGQTYTYAFTAQSYPAVGMYHSHHNATKQVGDGLAGAFIVGDLPTPAGVTVTQRHTMMLNDTGTIGFSLNGKSFPATAPVTAKVGEWVEMHYLNEGVMAHPMHLHGLVQLVTAKDGFPLPQPYRADTVMVAPGERITVLIQVNKPGVWAWHCHILPHAERDDGMFGMVTALIAT